jgi:hypothetical protein
VSDLTEMWAALERYQPYADKAGHGESWKRMTTERTAEAAWAAWGAAGGVADLAQYSNYEDAADAAYDAAWKAWAALAPETARVEAKYSAARAIEFINKAMEVQP